MWTAVKKAEESDLKVTSISIENTIQLCFDNFQYDDALILAETLYNKDHTELSAFLLAKCFALQGKIENCYYLLKSAAFNSARCSYLMAKSAFDLERFDDCIKQLTDETVIEKTVLHPRFNGTSILPFAHSLLAKTLRESSNGNLENVQNHFKQSIMSNCLLWSSIKNYCDAGGKDVGEICSKAFLEIYYNLPKSRTKDSLKTSKRTQSNCLQSQIVSNRKRAQVQVSFESSVPKKKSIGVNSITNVNHRKSLSTTESIIETRRSLRLFSAQEDENCKIHLNRNCRESNPRIKSQSPVIPRKLNFNEGDEEVEDDLKKQSAMHLRRAISRVTQPLTSVDNATNIEEKNKKKSTTPTDSIFIEEEEEPDIIEEDMDEPMELENSNPLSQQKKTNKNVIREIKTKNCEATESIGKWMIRLAQAQQYLSRFRCSDALKILDTIENNFAKLPLTLELKAKLFFESGEYLHCCRVCEEICKLYPQRSQGMEIFSTSLWQLQDSYRLSALCSEMVNVARNEPEAWCVAGNCFSLEKQHETAVECLERAIRINPKFGYAYSLLGHELIILNDLHRAAQAFQKAIVCMPNDYRPWYGLGLVYYKEEQMELAKVNLVKAVKINPTNIIILCQLSLIEQSLQNNKAAIDCLNRALSYAPNNVACLYHKARLLFDTGRYMESMEELNKLKSLSPDEAHVFYLLGRVYRKLGDHHMALLSYSCATEIDPRGEQNHSALSDQGPYDDDPVDFNETTNNASDASLY